ncbi:lactonase family protein [Mariniblastus fucicola]|uniref:6-phosphogluconolactonase n=1 Tax=Mariniblastus fucicola TaxID=980251 RepID=A0A5B9P646_9BACT|nr:lactonase family protein [Mariniblastus fucicola]QEG20655.1 6-phosphogluconolactonase [Mariniblastus fucicola]
MKVFSIAILLLISFSAASIAEELDVWFGTGGNNAGQPAGIWHASFNTQSGDLSESRLALELVGTGWIAWHPKLPIIYSTANVNGKPSVCSIKVADDNTLSILQTVQISNGSCFLTTDQTGSVLISAQYGGGTVISIPIDDDGLLEDSVQEIRHTGGSNVVPRRQKSPHPHYAEVSPDNQFVFVPDLGLDQLVVYKLDLENQKLVATEQPVACVKGGGPRHMKILNATKPDGPNFAFVLNELAMSMSCFELQDGGAMKLVETVPTLSEDQRSGEIFNSASEVRIHPGGKFIYSANRGHDSISVFRFEAESLELGRVQTASIHGAWPRNFNLTPDGKWLLAAGAHTNSVTVFSIDAETGKLTYQKKSAFVPGAICVSIR